MKTVRTKKSTAFWAGFLGLLSMFFITVLFAKDALAAIAPGIVAGIVGVCTAYQGTNVLDNYQRSKHFNAELAKEGKEE